MLRLILFILFTTNPSNSHEMRTLILSLPSSQYVLLRNLVNNHVYFPLVLSSSSLRFFSSFFSLPKISFHLLSYFFEPPQPLAFGLNAISVLCILSLWSPSLKNRQWNEHATCRRGADKSLVLVLANKLFIIMNSLLL